MFVEEYLVDLRRERFRPAAVLHYLRRTGARLRDEALANPGAVRSIWTSALGFFCAAFVGAVILALGHDRALAYDFLLWTAAGIVVTFSALTLGVDHLRDREGYRLSGLNLPTLLTLVRPVLLPGLVLFLLEGRLSAALVIFVFAALTDVADGWLARHTGQVTRLGVVLDPFVDIAFNFVSFLGLGAAGLVPPWVMGVATLRYGLLIAGGVAINLLVGPVRIQPTLFGRLTGVLLSTLVGFDLMLHVVKLPEARLLLPLTEVALGGVLCATVGHVVVLGWYNLRELKRRDETPGRVVGDVRWGKPGA